MSADVAGVPLPPPLVYLAGLGVGAIVEWFWPTPDLAWPLAVLAGVLGAAAFLLLAGGAQRRFSRAGTPAIPFQPSTALVVSGPYRFTRNPMYLGMAVLHLGLALAFGLLWALALLPVVVLVIDRLVIAREEPYLERRFGAEYVAFKSRVRRWM